jgi:outer membrane protein assembly factor BamB
MLQSPTNEVNMKENSSAIGTFDRNYYFSEKASLPFNIKWKFKTCSIGRPLSQPLVIGDRIWLFAPIDKIGDVYDPAMVYEIDATAGEKIWEFRIDQRMGWVSQNCMYKMQFMTSTKNDIIGLQNGQLTFTANSLSRKTESIVNDGEYIFCSRDDGIIKINSNGELVKHFEIVRPSAIALYDDQIIFGAANCLFCISSSEMELIWKTDLSELGKCYDKIKSRRQKKDIYSMGKLKGRYAVVSGKKVFCNVGSNIVCLSAESGDFLWKGDAAGDPVHVGNKLISYDTVGNFYCINSNNGEIFYKTHPTDIHGLNASMPFVSSDVFFIGTNKILAIDINRGSLLWEYQSDEKGTFFFDPIYINGYLYTGCSDGYLYCFSIKQ